MVSLQQGLSGTGSGEGDGGSMVGRGKLASVDSQGGLVYV